jgi:phage shock protein PspC (stress-responsive transcriptional regulator)
MKRYYRSRDDRKIAGVCGGLGKLMNADPTLVRLGFVVLMIATGIAPLVVGYVAAWIVAPEEPGGTAATPPRPGS